MRRIIILILFIFVTLPVFAEDVIYLDKKWDKEASRILYEYELKEQKLTPNEAYKVFGYKQSDVRAVFYDLNSDGINEVIGYVYAPYSFSCDGWSLKILKKEINSYIDISGVNTQPAAGLYIYDTKTDGFKDIKVYPSKKFIPTIAKYNHKQQYYEYFFPN